MEGPPSLTSIRPADGGSQQFPHHNNLQNRWVGSQGPQINHDKPQATKDLAHVGGVLDRQALQVQPAAAATRKIATQPANTVEYGYVAPPSESDFGHGGGNSWATGGGYEDVKIPSIGDFGRHEGSNPGAASAYENLSPGDFTGMSINGTNFRRVFPKSDYNYY